ncbi:MAG: YceH family protein [Cellvibrionaceae bacterium]
MIELSLNETRVLGVLFEKERTTPDQYPLSLNALANGCNQKSNRYPVLSLDESIVQETLDSLVKKSLVAEVTLSSRVPKYRQRFGNTQFSETNVSLKEHSILTVLFLRGPQTPGELRTRTNRLCDFSDVSEVEQVLQELIERPGDAYVAKLPREAGKRESRYAHLFSGELEIHRMIESSKNQSISNGERALTGQSSAGHNCEECSNRINLLEQQVELMRNDLDELKELWNDLNS